jgi:hypothetical protein
MAGIVYCPECESTVNFPERLFGQIVRCPSCRASFRAEAPVAEKPALQVVDHERSRSAGGKAPGIEDREEEANDAHLREREAEEQQELEEDPRRVGTDAGEVNEEAKALNPEGRDREERDSDEDLPGPQPNRQPFTVDVLASWRRVQSGLMFVMAAAIVGLLANIGGAIGFASVDPYSTREASVAAKVNTLLPRMVFEEPAPRPATLPTGRLALTMILFYSACACAAGLAIAGNLYCMVIPNQRNARSTLTSSIAMLCFGLFLFAGAWLYLYVRVEIWQNGVKHARGTTLDGPPLEGIVIFIFGATLLLAQPALFSLFLRNAARAVGANWLATSLIFQTVVPVIVALGFVLASISWYSALKGAINAEFAGTYDAAFATETVEIAELVIKILYFVYVGYAVWFVASLIVTRITITRAMRYS